jgi:putative membrane protein
MNFIIKVLLSAVSVILTSYLLPGVHTDGVLAAVVVAVLLALLNATLRPILVVLTIPITILSMGLFLLVINAIIILIADSVVPGFQVDGFWWALFFSIILSIVNSILESLSRKDSE